jgi:hypothetical protein
MGSHYFSFVLCPWILFLVMPSRWIIIILSLPIKLIGSNIATLAVYWSLPTALFFAEHWSRFYYLSDQIYFVSRYDKERPFFNGLLFLDNVLYCYGLHELNTKVKTMQGLLFSLNKHLAIWRRGGNTRLLRKRCEFDSRTVQTFVCINMSVCIGSGCFYV